jgi:transglutaminase-like putative cysteine protease
VPAEVWDTTISTLPGLVARSYVDEEGRTLRTSIPLMPGMEFTMIEADEQLARAQINAPELMLSTLIEPDRRIAGPRGLRRAAYRVTVAAAEPGAMDIVGDVALPSTGFQRVTKQADGSYLVSVNLDAEVDVAAAAPTNEFRRSTSVLNHEDPAIRALLAEASRGWAADAPPAVRAESLRQFVNTCIDDKALSVGFATASEVARTKQGDCSEHAVLLAALLRAAGIPSRTVTGVLYVEEFLGRRGVFGYHMWAQAWVDGRWLDLDAVLDANTPFDATHITLGTSAMAEATMTNDMVAVMPLIGRMSIQVLDPPAEGLPRE